MSKYSHILEILRKIYKENKFSLGLHTTNHYSASSIIQSGLEERSGRTIEGTVKFFGDAQKDVKLGDLDWFFPYTNSTVIVAIPAIFKIERDLDSESGNKHTCDFSLFVEMAKNGHLGENAKSIFSNDGKISIPPELIVGYYDKLGSFTLNEKCELLNKNSEFIKQIESIWTDKQIQAKFKFFKSMSKDSLNYGDSNKSFGDE